jgi:hypothetical protein
VDELSSQDKPLAEDKVLEVGIGNVDRIYVVAHLEDKWEIAQGGIFSYYEFDQPRNQRLTDDVWRAKLDYSEVEMPVWASNFVMMGGKPKEVLFFRVGDIYVITEAGDALNVRDQPSLNGSVVVQLNTNGYVEIVDGPVQADGYTWWKVELFNWGSDTIFGVGCRGSAVVCSINPITTTRPASDTHVSQF